MHESALSWSEHLPGALLAADNARYSAMLKGDIAALEEMLSPQLTYTHSDGQTDNWQEYLQLIKTGSLQYRKVSKGKVLCMDLGRQALLRGELMLEALFKGQEASIRIHYLAVWTLVDGIWQMVAWASTRLPLKP